MARGQGPLSDRPAARHRHVRDLLVEGAGARAAIAAGLVPRGRSPVVVKAIGKVLRGGSVRAVAAYIGRFDRRSEASPEDAAAAAQYAVDLGAPGEDVFGTMRDEHGDETTPAAFVERFSPATGYQEAEVRHLVLAVPGSAIEAMVAAQAWMVDVLVGPQLPAAWAVHTDHTEQAHVHVLLAARLPSWDGAPGPMLPFAPDGRFIDGLRAVLARHAREMGMDVSAERASDRPDWSADPPLAKVALLGEGRAGSREVIETDDPFALRLRRGAPAWYARWGEMSLPRTGMVTKTGPLDMFAADDRIARASYRMLAEENGPLAAWMAEHRPDVLRAAGLIHLEPGGETPAQKRRRRWHRQAVKERVGLAQAIEAWGVGLALPDGQHIGPDDLQRRVSTTGPVGLALMAIAADDPRLLSPMEGVVASEVAPLAARCRQRRKEQER